MDQMNGIAGDEKRQTPARALLSDVIVSNANTNSLRADEQQIRLFVETVFKRCFEDGRPIEGRIALRAFPNAGKGPPVLSRWERLSEAPIQRAVEAATEVARAGNAVFCPPVCLFGLDGKAGNADVTVGPVIAVDIDKTPNAGRKAIEAVLGKPTLVVASGGYWQGPDGPEQKLHLYWRLNKPAVTEEERALLASVRKRAGQIAGGDGTAGSIAHPLRWPGSWHLKGTPRLCQIIERNPDVDIDLADAAGLTKADFYPLSVSAAEFDAENPAWAKRRQWTRAELLDVAEHLQNIDDIGDGRETDWDEFTNIGLALYAVSHGNDDGLDAFMHFSEKSKRHDYDVTQERWDNFRASPPTRFATGWGLIDRIRKESDPVYCLPQPPISEERRVELHEIFAFKPKVESEVDQSRQRFRFLSLDEIEETAFIEPEVALVQDFLDQGAFSVMYGQSNAGKSFVALSLAHAISQGRPWAGQKTEKRATLYIATEGGSKLKYRALALRRAYGRNEIDAPFKVLSDSIDVHGSRDDISDFIAKAKAIPDLGFIIIDTLARTFGGGDESSAKDMNAFVRNVDRIRSATKAHVMVIHHAGKDDAKGARGSSVLRAAADTEIVVEASRSDDGERAGGLIKDTKQRDRDVKFSRTFVLEAANLKDDKTGFVIPSGVAMVSSEPAGARKSAASKAQQEILDAMRDLGAQHSALDVHEIAKALGDDKTLNAIRMSLRKLADKKLVLRKGTKWALPPSREPADWFDELNVDQKDGATDDNVDADAIASSEQAE